MRASISRPCVVSNAPSGTAMITRVWVSYDIGVADGGTAA
jgi:hypothetical protein